MASLLVVIELVDDRPRPASLELLGQARRIGSELGATVYTVAACARPPGYGDDDLIAVLSRHGADKVLLSTAEAHGGPMRWGTHGGAVLGACELMHPMLVLLADGDGARDLGGRVAARLGAAAICDAFIEITDGVMALWEGGGDEGPRRITAGDDSDLDFAVMALVPPGRYQPAIGDEEAEVEILEPGESERDFQPAGDGGDWPTAAVMGDGDAATSLARSLGGTTGPLGRAELRIALGEGCARLASFAGEPSCRVALGGAAPHLAFAHYALDGTPADLARELGAVVGSGQGPADREVQP